MKTSWFAHETVIIDADVTIGNGTRIWHFSHIRPGVTIGDDCNLGQNTYVDEGVVIGNRVKIQNNVSVYKGVVLEDDVFIGPSVVFTNVINPRSFIDRKHEIQTTHIKRGATIGANATIICGGTIGEYAMVGAGTVVLNDVAPFTVVVGNPARVIGKVDKEGNIEKL